MPCGKSELENAVFARAARLNTEVDSLKGALVSASRDACLQALIAVYNAFFAAENKLFLADCEEEDEELVWREYLRQRSWPPPMKRPPGVPFFMQDFAAELFFATTKKPRQSGAKKTNRTKTITIA